MGESIVPRLFMPRLRDLGGIPFYPVIGNHEVERSEQCGYRTAGPSLPIALDNVSRWGEGFGGEQLSWLAGGLQAASAAKSIILAGMHKALAKNPITTHAMDEDGPGAVRDSDAALALFKQYGVAMLFVSHSHMYATYNQDGIETRLTGGLGAPLVKGLAEVDRFPGAPIRDQEDESLEVEN